MMCRAVCSKVWHHPSVLLLRHGHVAGQRVWALNLYFRRTLGKACTIAVMQPKENAGIQCSILLTPSSPCGVLIQIHPNTNGTCTVRDHCSVCRFDFHTNAEMPSTVSEVGLTTDSPKIQDSMQMYKNIMKQYEPILHVD